MYIHCISRICTIYTLIMAYTEGSLLVEQLVGSPSGGGLKIEWQNASGELIYTNCN